MERYIYYSIILFSSFILLLYVYLLYEKLTEIRSTKKSKRYEQELIPLIDSLFRKMEEGEINQEDIKKIRAYSKDKIKRRIIIDRIIFYNEIYSGIIRQRASALCEQSDIVAYESRNLKSKDNFVVALACKNLGEFRSKEAIEPLLSVLDRKSVDVQYHAILALSKIGDLEAFSRAFSILGNRISFSERGLTEIIDSYEGDKGELYKRMIKSENIYVSTIFIKSAGNYMDLELNRIIADFIYDADKDRRIAAIKAIGQNGDLRFTDKILQALQDKEWEVRAAAAKSLGRMEESRALDYLISALSDSVWWVRYNAANSIIRISNGINRLEVVFSSSDKFAKDIILAAMEDSGVLQDVFLYEHSLDENKRRLFSTIKDYMLSRAY